LGGGVKKKKKKKKEKKNTTEESKSTVLKGMRGGNRKRIRGGEGGTREGVNFRVV